MLNSCSLIPLWTNTKLIGLGQFMPDQLEQNEVSDTIHTISLSISPRVL